jgi:hypothetical protein
MEQFVDCSLSAGSLNLEQWKLYNIIIESYIQELSSQGIPGQLLLNINDIVRTRKIYTLMIICARLQELTLQTK